MIVAKRLWGIKVIHGSEDHGWVVDHGRVVCVYDDKDFAEKDAKWMNDFKRRCGSKGSYEVKKWVGEDGVDTALQTPTPKEVQMMKMNERRKTVAAEASSAPAPTINTNLSELFMESMDASDK